MDRFTPEDLLLYLYKEVSQQKKQDIERALALDWTLQEKMNVLKGSMDRLSKLTQQPRTEVVLNVLNYARENAEESFTYR